MQDMRRSFFPRVIEICMETPGWCPSGWAPTWRPETNRNICHQVLQQKRKFISQEVQNIIKFFQYKNCSDSLIPQNKSRNNSLFNQLGCHENAASRKSLEIQVWSFGTKMCVDISFQLLLHIIKAKYQEDQ